MEPFLRFISIAGIRMDLTNFGRSIFSFGSNKIGDNWDEALAEI